MHSRTHPPRFSALAVVCLTCLLLTAACTTTEVTSKKDTDYTTLVQDLYLASEISDELDSFEDEAIVMFDSTMTRAGVVVHVKRLQPSTDSTTDDPSAAFANVPFASAHETGAIALLHLKERSRDQSISGGGAAIPTAGGGTMTVRSGTNQTYMFDASLYDLETEERVWRAEVETKGHETSSQEREGRVMAREVMRKLVMDGVLPPEVVFEIEK